MTDLPAISTKRLTLRAPTPDDLGAYRDFYAVSDLRVGKYRGPRSADEVARILQDDFDHWRAKGFGMWVLRRTDDDTIIGGCGLAHPDDWPRHELTWWLMPAARGQGYASEASRAVIAWAYEDRGWSRVETHMRDENIPARKLTERLGGLKIAREVFPDGVARDVYAFPRESAA